VSKQPFEIHVSFECHHCGKKIEAAFIREPVAVISCSECHNTFTIMRPTVAEEILIDWENEAMFQKIRADKTQSSNSSLMKLIIQVIELLTWRDKGDGQVEAIRAMREWLIDNEGPPSLAELIKVDNKHRRFNKRN
jgi:transcription elongation factor Elf1